MSTYSLIVHAFIRVLCQHIGHVFIRVLCQHIGHVVIRVLCQHIGHVNCHQGGLTPYHISNKSLNLLVLLIVI